MFYIVAMQYSPNTASNNRILAYLKALSELRVPTRAVFFFPDRKHSKVSDFLPNVDIYYMWDRWFIDLPYVNKLSLFLYIKKFVKHIEEGDRVLVYGFPDLVVALSERRDISVFVETTEHPNASFCAFIKGTTIPRYLQACAESAGVVVISNKLRDYFIGNGCGQERVHVVNMIVDTSRFEKIKKQTTTRQIAYCGTASNTKDGVDQLIQAFAIVEKQHPEYRLIIIGSTPSPRQRFENLELVRRYGIEHKVVFTGIISTEDIPQMLKNATILALDRPDNLQAQYGFPTKLGEYLLTANPVVVTRVGDIPVYLKDGESALIAEPDNPQAFADRLCWAIDHPREAIAIGENGRTVAEQNFNYLNETKKLISIVFS